MQRARHQPPRQERRVDVVDGELIAVLVEGVQRRRGEHAHLAHRAAQASAGAGVAVDDQIARPRQHRAAGRAQSLWKTPPTRDRTAPPSWPRRLVLATSAFHRSRAVEIRGHAVPRAACADAHRLVVRKHDATAAVVRVLDFDERRRRHDDVARAARRAASISAAVNTPPAPSSVNCTPALAPPPPVSDQTAWLSRLTSTVSPGRVSTRSATWLAIVPDGTHRAASLPRSAATRSWS